MDARRTLSMGSGEDVRTGGVTVTVDAGEMAWGDSTNGGRRCEAFDRFSALFEAVEM